MAFWCKFRLPTKFLKSLLLPEVFLKAKVFSEDVLSHRTNKPNRKLVFLAPVEVPGEELESFGGNFCRNMLLCPTNVLFRCRAYSFNCLCFRSFTTSLITYMNVHRVWMTISTSSIPSVFIGPLFSAKNLLIDNTHESCKVTSFG